MIPAIWQEITTTITLKTLFVDGVKFFVLFLPPFCVALAYYTLWISNSLTSVSYQIGGSMFLEKERYRLNFTKHCCCLSFLTVVTSSTKNNRQQTIKKSVIQRPAKIVRASRLSRPAKQADKRRWSAIKARQSTCSSAYDFRAKTFFQDTILCYY